MGRLDRENETDPEGSSVNLSGSRLVYRDAASAIFQLVFSPKLVRWKCVEGEFEGESGSAPYRAACFGRDTLLIAWSRPSGEAAVIVVKPGEDLAQVCHLYGEECDFVAVEILGWTPSVRGSVAAERPTCCA